MIIGSLTQGDITIINIYIPKSRPPPKYMKQNLRELQGEIDNATVIVEDITTDLRKFLKAYYEQIYAKKLDNIDERGKFLERHKSAKLIQEEIV